MFDSVLNKGAGPKSAFGRGAIFTALFHAGAIALAFWLGTRPEAVTRELTEVTFFSPAAAPLPPAKLGSDDVKAVEQPKPVEKKKVVKKPDTFVKPKEEVVPPKDEVVPEQEPETVAPPDEPIAEEKGNPNGIPEGDEQGSEKGKLGGSVTGREDGTTPGGTGTDVVRFGEGMTPPRKLSGEEIQYTREAREARIEGTAIVECVITVEGSLERCRLVKGLPLMGDSILRAVGTWRYTPVIYQGRPVNVRKVFNITLKLH